MAFYKKLKNHFGGAMKISSEVEVCNLALLKINQSSISSFDEGSVQSEACKKVYDQARAYLLSQYNWTFAINRTLLNVVSENSGKEPTDINYDHTLFEYTRKFGLPEKFLRLISVYNGSNQKLIAVTGLKPPFVLEGGFLLSDQKICKIKYIKDTETVASFPPQFLECFILDLAIRLTKFFNDSTSYLQQLYGDYQLQLEKAKISDCQQTMIGGVESYPLIAESWRF